MFGCPLLGPSNTCCPPRQELFDVRRDAPGLSRSAAAQPGREISTGPSDSRAPYASDKPSLRFPNTTRAAERPNSAGAASRNKHSSCRMKGALTRAPLQWVVRLRQGRDHSSCPTDLDRNHPTLIAPRSAYHEARRRDVRRNHSGEGAESRAPRATFKSRVDLLHSTRAAERPR